MEQRVFWWEVQNDSVHLFLYVRGRYMAKKKERSTGENEWKEEGLGNIYE